MASRPSRNYADLRRNQTPLALGAFRCITYDQRGYGLSSLPTGNEDAGVLWRDLAGLLDHLGIEQAFLVAQSLGGWATWGLAAHQPERVRALVMGATPGGVPAPAVKTWFRDLGQRNRAGQNLLANAVSPLLAREQPAMSFLYWQIQGLNPPPVDGSEMLRQLAEREVMDLASFSIPTLFIVGDDDELIPPAIIEATAAVVPGSQLLRVPGAGHSVYFEKPALFNAAVLDFFSKLRRV